MSELKPCPFCGGKPEMREYRGENGGNYAYVRCEECWTKGQEANYGQSDLAAQYWNRRAPSTPAPPIADDAALARLMRDAYETAVANGHNPLDHWRATLSVARPAIERAARAKVLDEAARETMVQANIIGALPGSSIHSALTCASAAILALKDRA